MKEHLIRTQVFHTTRYNIQVTFSVKRTINKRQANESNDILCVLRHG